MSLNKSNLSSRFQAHDSLISEAEFKQHGLRKQALEALRLGDFDLAESAMNREDASVQELVENLRIYQAELYAQAEELSHSQARLEAALQLFGALFSNLPVAALLVGSNGELLETNRKSNELFALRARHASQRFIHRLVASQEYQTRVRPLFLEARASGIASCDTVTFLTEAGTRFRGDLHLAMLPQGGAQGAEGGLQAPQFACVILDRSADLEHLEALHELNVQLAASEAAHRLSSLVATHTGNPVVIADAGQSIVFANPAFYALTGLSADEVMDKPLSLLWRGAQTPESATHALLRSLDAGEGCAGFEIAGHTKDGAPYWALLDLQPVRDADGALTHFVALATDITASRHAQERIEELSERLTLATQAGGVGIWDWDLASDQTFFDPRMRALLYCAEQGPVSLRSAIEAKSGPAEMVRFDAALAAVQAGQDTLQLELRLLPRRGEEVALRLNGRAHRAEDGRTLRLLGCAWDCTAERVAENMRLQKESADKASKAKSAFLSRMSHELRTPLNAILGFSQLMQMDSGRQPDFNGTQPQRAQYIEQAARHLLELINEVLDVTRIESGRLDLDLCDTPVHGAIAQCLPMVEMLAAEHRVVLRDETVGAAELRVYADALRLKEILTNLLSNAIKYNRPGGLVTLHAERVGTMVEISVTDTGVGMTEDQLRDLFQPFNRVGAERTVVEGSGMGLFISQRYAQLMGGLLNSSSVVGVGSIFTLRLPLGRSLPR